jgi:hypothetical protein
MQQMLDWNASNLGISALAGYVQLKLHTTNQERMGEVTRRSGARNVDNAQRGLTNRLLWLWTWWTDLLFGGQVELGCYFWEKSRGFAFLSPQPPLRFLLWAT